MVIAVDENILLFVVGSIFIPVVISYLKLHSKLEQVYAIQSKNLGILDEFSSIKSEMNGIRIRLEYLERDSNSSDNDTPSTPIRKRR